MGWFEEQVKQRKMNDADALTDSMLNMVGAVLGRRAYAVIRDERLITQNALDEILKYFHIRSKQLPSGLQTLEERIDFLMRPSGIMYRNVKLEAGWSKDCIGPLLLTRKADGQIVAMIPDSYIGYHFIDVTSGKCCKLNEKAEALFEGEAYCFYKPLPLRCLSTKDLLLYSWKNFSALDVVLLVATALLMMLLGMIAPYLYSYLISRVSSLNSSTIWVTFLFLLSVIISSTLFSIIQTLLLGKIQMKIGLYTESAVMMRLLSMPTTFFGRYSTGNLASRVRLIPAFCEQMTETIYTLALPAVFSIAYLVEMRHFSTEMIPVCLWMLIIQLAVSLLTFWAKYKQAKQCFEWNAKVEAVDYALFSGIQKIKVAGAEKRVFAKWGNLYAKAAEYSYNPPLLTKIGPAITAFIPLAFTVFIYYYAWTERLDVGSYFAVTVLFGMVTGAFLPFSNVLMNLGEMLPILDMVKPILEEVPEIADGKTVIQKLRGNFEISHAYFRYKENMPYVLEDFSLKVQSGQYVAIVGESGCGKSTLLRILLGFENLSKGAVFYNGRDIKTLDLKSLRNRMGVVLQNSKLFLGDICSNIRIASPQLSMDAVWEAAEKAGIADDIRNMPMGMFTMIGEGIGGISGGQAQRIMIARAIAGQPDILLFDEATSALDNIMQRRVMEALSDLPCTKVVIAHRLSTVKECDRIVLLKNGKIAEDGTYDELIQKNGYFAKLVKAQLME